MDKMQAASTANSDLEIGDTNLVKTNDQIENICVTNNNSVPIRNKKAKSVDSIEKTRTDEVNLAIYYVPIDNSKVNDF